ncbi:hypothetical protein [Chitinophaga solisilvae]|uniref:hypothetical protein n=1 Tax=Chitinophaga solisilvae TaxID=1233460 RepID=UPI00136A5340|nr:hypothetical protein [Chitinophaga solisilvae]
MKKLTLIITMLFAVQLIVVAANPPSKKRTAGVHSARGVSILVTTIYIYRDNGYEYINPLCSIMATAKAYVLNRQTNSYNYISCPSSATNVVVSVGDQLELRYKPTSGNSGSPLASGPYTVTQEDITRGTIELSVGYTNNEHLQ